MNFIEENEIHMKQIALLECANRRLVKERDEALRAIETAKADAMEEARRYFAGSCCDSGSLIISGLKMLERKYRKEAGNDYTGSSQQCQ